MKQNIYDDERFFEGYAQLRENAYCLNDVLEEPTVLSLLPDLKGQRVLDLGCGFGKFARIALKEEALEICGVDISERMLARAEAEVNDTRARFVRCPIEDFEPEAGYYDVAVSSLCFHYPEYFTKSAKKI